MKLTFGGIEDEYPSLEPQQTDAYPIYIFNSHANRENSDLELVRINYQICLVQQESVHKQQKMQPNNKRSMG